MAVHAQRFDDRQSMKNKRFEVFHYREAKPQAVGVHHHDFYEIYFFLGGEVSFHVEGKTYHLEPGDLLLINPQELHQPLVQPGGVYERIVLWIDRGFLAGLCQPGMDLTTCFDTEHSNLLHPPKVLRTVIHDLLENMTKEYYSQELGGALYAEGLLLQLMVMVNRLASQGGRTVRAQETDLVSRVVSFISSHYQENITLESLSKEFYVSKYYLSHEFSRRTGTSVYQYVILKRLMQARELIAAGQAPGEAYKSCGFGDYANFYRAFKAEYGISPRQIVDN